MSSSSDRPTDCDANPSIAPSGMIVPFLSMPWRRLAWCGFNLCLALALAWLWVLLSASPAVGG